MEFISPLSDFGFKRLFGNTEKPHIAISFLNSVLDLRDSKSIKNITFLDPHNRHMAKLNKLSIVDVKCVDQSGNKFIIEMQFDSERDFAQRAQEYVACSIVDQLEVGDEYSKILPVYFVGVINFNMIKTTEEPITTYRPVQVKKAKDKDYSMFMDDALLNLSSWTFIELKKFRTPLEACETLVDKWLYLLRYAHEQKEIPALFGIEKVTKDAFELLNQGSMNSDEIAQYRANLNALRAENSVIRSAKEEGREEGEHNAKLTMAKALLNKMSVAEVAEITGLSADVLKKL